MSTSPWRTKPADAHPRLPIWGDRCTGPVPRVTKLLHVPQHVVINPLLRNAMAASGPPYVRVKIGVSPGTDSLLASVAPEYTGQSSADCLAVSQSTGELGHAPAWPGVPLLRDQRPHQRHPCPCLSLKLSGFVAGADQAGGCRSPWVPPAPVPSEACDVPVSFSAGWPQPLPCMDVVLEDLHTALPTPPFCLSSGGLSQPSRPLHPGLGTHPLH